MVDFSRIRGVIMDMDGVLWLGEQPLPHLHAFFNFLAERGVPVVLATNNSRKTPRDYVAKLARMGVLGFPQAHILTSGIATALYMKAHYPPQTRVHVVGGDGLREELNQAGMVLSDEEGVGAVVVGLDTEFTYEKARRAVRFIMQGAHFIGSNPDRSYPLEDGIAPGAGSLIALLETATRHPATIIGKPYRAMFEMALGILGCSAEQGLMIGDRLNTDIEGGYGAGLQTAMVLTGVDNRDHIARSDVKPTGIYDDLGALMQAWEAHA